MANPNTDRQKLTRKKFALLGSLAGVFTEFLKMTMQAYAIAKKTTPQGQFVKQNYECFEHPESLEQLAVEYETLSLTPPGAGLTPVAPGEANFDTPLEVSVAINDGYYNADKNSANDKVYLVVLSKANEFSDADVVYSDGTAKRTDDQVSVTVPSYWQGNFVETYVVVMADPLSQRAGDWSRTLYCGSGRIA